MPVRCIRFGAQDDPVDQATEQVSGLGFCAVFVQGRGEVSHLAGVDVCDAGMDRGWLNGGQGVQLGRKIRPFGLKPIHLRLHRRMIHPFGDRGDDAIDLAQHLGKATLCVASGGEAFEPVLLALPVILRDEFCNQVRVQQFVLQAGQNTGLDIAALDRLAVGAGA